MSSATQLTRGIIAAILLISGGSFIVTSATLPAKEEQGRRPEDGGRVGSIDDIADELRHAVESAFVAKHQLGPGCDQKLVRIIEEEEDDGYYALRLIKERSCTSLLEEVGGLSKAGRMYVRELAAMALGAIGSPGAIGSLLKLTRDHSDLVRRAAIEALCKVEPRECSGVAAKMAFKDISSMVRGVSVGLAARAGHPFGADEWKSLLRHPSEEVVVAAARALGCDDLSHPRIVTELLIIAREGDGLTSVRSSAIGTLGRCQVSGAAETLIEIFLAEGRQIPNAGIEVLEGDMRLQLMWMRLVQSMVRCAGTRARTALEEFATSHSSKPEMAPLIGNMPTTLVTVYEALAEVGGPSTRTALKRGLVDPYVVVRYAALRATARLGLVSHLRHELEDVSLKDGSEQFRKEVRRLLSVQVP